MTEDSDDIIGAILAKRGESYGPIPQSFARIAKLWSIVLGIEVSPQQVALCMVALKLARLVNDPDHLDSAHDIEGYARCLRILLEDQHD